VMKNRIKEKRRNPSGTTLIEMLAFLFIFVVVCLAFYSTWSSGTTYIILAKNRLAASALANEKMEIVRNLAYDDIGLTTGDPSGNINENEDVARSGRTFHVFTQISNVDDPYDGTLGGSPNDSNFIDYKAVKITISWENEKYQTSISSRFVPPGIEQPVAGRGILVINVSSDKKDNELVKQSTVRVQNTETGFDETHNTDNFGRLMLVGLRESVKKYQVTLSKNGYEDVSTLPPYPNPPYNYDPVHEDASVIAGSVNTINMYQNELGNLTVKTQDYLGNAVADIHYHLLGGRKIGSNHDDSSQLFFSTDQDYQTDSDGKHEYQSISPGDYNFNLEEAGYKIIGFDPILSPAIPSSFSTNLAASGSATLNVKIAPTNKTSLLLNVIKADDGKMFQGASVHVTNSSGYDTTLTTGADGKVFFPSVQNPPFSNGDYDVSITAEGYQDYNGTITVSSDQLKEETVTMNVA
jgi:hypothetical protein